MSLFHVLKYPISNPPEAKELANIPSAILLPWLEWIKISTRYEYYSDEKSYQCLRRLITDYEEI